MRQWYYTEASQQHGPIAEPEFAGMFESGQLPADTMVWTEGLEEWVVARDVDGLIPPAYKPSPPPVPATAAYTVDYAPSGEQVRPWIRYWARMIDCCLFCFLVGIVHGFVHLPAFEMPDTLVSIVLLFAYVFVEPAMLAAWGTTPGKGLLKVRLRTSEGRKLSYGDALSRAFKVWFRGEGLGIPIVNLFTQITAYNRLTKQGVTSWDKEAELKVSHQTIDAWRIIVAVVIMLGMFFLMVIGNADI